MLLAEQGINHRKFTTRQSAVFFDFFLCVFIRSFSQGDCLIYLAVLSNVNHWWTITMNIKFSKILVSTDWMVKKQFDVNVIQSFP